VGFRQVRPLPTANLCSATGLRALLHARLLTNAALAGGGGSRPSSSQSLRQAARPTSSQSLRSDAGLTRPGTAGSVCSAPPDVWLSGGRYRGMTASQWCDRPSPLLLCAYRTVHHHHARCAARYCVCQLLPPHGGPLLPGGGMASTAAPTTVGRRCRGHRGARPTRQAAAPTWRWPQA
jgi:hypothetical protein